MKVLVSGSHGLVGTALTQALTEGGHRVVHLVRGRPGSDEVAWDIPAGRIDTSGLAGVEGVVHLAGASLLGPRRWTEERKAVLQDSRVDGTRLLATALAGLATPPAVLVSASGINYYGDRGAEVLDEASGPGTGFLAGLCRAWEAATAPAAEAGVRVVRLRSGIVQSARGGALAVQLPIFRAGLGGRLGSGRQYLSWISLADEVGAIIHALEDPAIEGPLNATAPEAVTNADYTRTLGRVLHRPTVLAVPGPVLRAVLGADLAEEMLLISERVRPARLAETGYRFRHPVLEGALRAALAPR